MVRTAGFEPALSYEKKILSLQRLPVPPRPHINLPSRLQEELGVGNEQADCKALPSIPSRQREGKDYSAVTSVRLSRSRISLPGLK